MVVWQGRRPVYGPKRTIGDEADTVPAAGAAEHGNAVARRRWRLLSPPISLGTPARSGWTSWTIRTRSKRPRDLEPMTKLVKGCAAGGSPCQFAARQRDGDLFAVGSHEVEAARLAGGRWCAIDSEWTLLVWRSFGAVEPHRRHIALWTGRRAFGCNGQAVWLRQRSMTTDRESARRPRPCLRPFIAPNRPATIQLAGQALGLPLRSKRSSGSMIARSRAPLRQVAALD